MASKQKVESKEVTLLLVGNAGNGKSATGNSILGQQAFKTTASTSSTTTNIDIASSSFKDLKINVLDIPGVDTNKSEEEFFKFSIDSIKHALKMCGYRFSALVIVLKCGARFTKQEIDFIKSIKGILGENVIKDFGVCIMTHGDSFEADYEDENLSFEEWCRQQEGDIKSLFKECNYRCVLFNNRTKDPRLKDSQVSELMAKITTEVQYNESDFRAADTGLQKLVMQIKAPNISREARLFIETKRQEIQQFEPNIDLEKDIRFYEQIKRDIENKEISLRRRYEKVDSIDQYLVDITVFKMETDNNIRTLVLKKQVKPTRKRQQPFNLNISQQKNLKSQGNESFYSTENQSESVNVNSKRPNNAKEQLKSKSSKGKNKSKGCSIL